MHSNYEIAPIPPSRNDSKNIIKSITPTISLSSSKSRMIQQQLQQQQQITPPLPSVIYFTLFKSFINLFLILETIKYSRRISFN
jgi:hypothetical protein